MTNCIGKSWLEIEVGKTLLSQKTKNPRKLKESLRLAKLYMGGKMLSWTHGISYHDPTLV